MADSELEEGELPGEVAPQGLLGGSPHAIAGAEAVCRAGGCMDRSQAARRRHTLSPSPAAAASVALPAAYDGHEPKEQLLAPRPDGR